MSVGKVQMQNSDIYLVHVHSSFMDLWIYAIGYLNKPEFMYKGRQLVYCYSGLRI